MTKCDTSTDGGACFIIERIVRNAGSRLNQTLQLWIEKRNSALRVGRSVCEGLLNDSKIVRNHVAQNCENALSAILGIRMALDFAFMGFGDFNEPFAPFYEGEIEDALAGQNFSDTDSDR